MKKYIFLLIVLCGCISNFRSIEKEKINIFIDRKDAVFSPDGILNRNKVAISPNDEFFVKELEPYDYGKIGLFSKDGQFIREIKVLEENENPNDLKSIAWHPNNYVIGVVFHKNNYSEIKLYEIFTGQLLRKLTVSNFYHYFLFNENGEKIYISKDGEKVEEINLRNTDFIFNSGINLPWINYGWDIGRNPWEKEHGGFSSNKEILTEKFNFFKKIGVKVVRVFLFCDLRSAVIFNEKGKFTFDNYVYRDFSTLIEVAEKTGLKILPVIFDYTIADGVFEENGVKVGEHPEIFNDIKLQKKLLSLFAEFFKKIDTKDIIYGWDIINEPEHLRIENSRIENFIFEFIKLIKKYRKKEKVTVGALSRINLNYYKKFNLDFYQFHYYDSFENNYYLNYHFYDLLLEKPVIIGEMEASDIINKLTKVWENGYKGVLIWPDEKFLSDGWKFFKIWVDVH
ncbi:MAG: hypothetical protein NC921_00600 [Candidatus Omnitrophica bacterium]|nr:hypothetical protein [Candidatus Omnitrophota bacterium]MCM8808687.1 hypothetical protein [Candidatus Omnitrophota bacterium]